MKTTILVSKQRSGTTFFDNTINGMCGFIDQGGEPLSSKNFFKRHEAIHLIERYDEKTSCEHTVKLSNDKEFCMRLSGQFFDDLCECSPRPMFNFQYDQLKFNPQYLMETQANVILLIRQNSWLRAISEYLSHNQPLGWVAHHKENLEKKLDVTIDIDSVEQRCARSNYFTETFKRGLAGRENYKIIYYEDICKKSYWTEKCIDELEHFMGVSFTNREYRCTWKKNRNQYNITNKEEALNEKLIKKYYIDKI
tara:strand:- start:3690 stop:4445 length:756 start_codon:yes stop_codon:yes gene_type:complete